MALQKLLQENHELRILHRTSSDLSDIDGLEYESFIGDVTDLNSLKKACQNVDSVFHLAGVVGYSKAARPLMQKVNVEEQKPSGSMHSKQYSPHTSFQFSCCHWKQF